MDNRLRAFEFNSSVFNDACSICEHFDDIFIHDFSFSSVAFNSSLNDMSAFSCFRLLAISIPP